MSLDILDWSQLDADGRRAALSRPANEDRAQLVELVRGTIARVRTEGDAALLDYARRFDGGAPINLRVPREEIDAAVDGLGNDARAALQRAIDNVRRFHLAQRTPPIDIETAPGVRCERILRAIDAVGLYVPGGSAPLPSALIMSAVPAAIAGCQRRILCSPGTRAGRIDPVILATARLCDVDEVFAIGGAQAIAAMAYGTETIPKVHKIFGPGSAWVTAAKQLVADDPHGAALDLPAGPSEVLVIADDSADARFVAADLLAQAEHDPLSQAILLTTSHEFAKEVRSAALGFVDSLSRREILRQSLARSRMLVLPDLDTAFAVSNDYAPEHLILHVREARRWLARVTTAGSVFLGPWSPEPMGDYCSGTNHVLPTYGYARAHSGLSVADFQRRITVQELTPRGLAGLGPTAGTLARLEGLDAHALAVDLRLQHADIRALAAVDPLSEGGGIDAVLALARPAIRALKAYEHAAWNPRYERLHANESPWPPLATDAGDSAPALNRYPEPQPAALVSALAALYAVAANSLLVGRGSDEIIDLLTRAFCEADRDAVIICPPTFGMYAVAAHAQGARVLEIPLTPTFTPDLPAIETAISQGAKILWLCSPNNPTGNVLATAEVERLLNVARGRCLVAIDEAYAEFSTAPSWSLRLQAFPHLVVLRTLSKAHGLAGSRIGTLLADPAIIALLRKIIPPYAIAASSAREALLALQEGALAVTRARIAELIRERARLALALATSPQITRVWPSEANFILVQCEDAAQVMQRLLATGLMVRDFSGRSGLGAALRITVGTPTQNTRLIAALGSTAQATELSE
ncbi:MAG: histidinol dehydrogenase [Gammaproteobacteria bacterium]|nr:histidinol dehydrogenase [Gammaproteobacteria bacterium]